MSLGKTITTANIYLKNVYQFLKYFSETPPLACRLSKSQQTSVIRAVKNSIRCVRRDVVLHQIKIKDAKVSTAVSRQTLMKCRDMARSSIPQLLGET